jgi:Shugoshin C terminus
MDEYERAQDGDDELIDAMSTGTTDSRANSFGFFNRRVMSCKFRATSLRIHSDITVNIASDDEVVGKDHDLTDNETPSSSGTATLLQRKFGELRVSHFKTDSCLGDRNFAVRSPTPGSSGHKGKAKAVNQPKGLVVDEPMPSRARRSRASISYAEPSLRGKMRRATNEFVDAVASDSK